jgi:uncharacterized glyoxalase superfamily protein PhnB
VADYRRMKFTNLVFWVQDNTLSVKFYIKLGFDVLQSDERNSTVQLGDLQIMLVSMRAEEEFNCDSLSGDKGRGMYVYLRTSNVDATYAELQSKGIIPATEPRDWPWGNREFIVKDPDGYKLCFWKESHQK